MHAQRSPGLVASAESVHQRAADLAEALDLGNGQLDPAAVGAATGLVDKVQERSALAGEHTVVALAGATGSGKSSLFNALAGAQIAQIGARRPTTSTPTAAVWGDEPAGALLDWLSVARRHVVDGEPGPATRDAEASGTRDAGDGPEGAADPTGESTGEATEASGQGAVPESAVDAVDAVDALDGLVLLDLPDFDSCEVAHRVEAERVLELCDVFVWVADPEKYADALLHDQYVRQDGRTRLGDAVGSTRATGCRPRRWSSAGPTSAGCSPRTGPWTCPSWPRRR